MRVAALVLVALALVASPAQGVGVRASAGRREGGIMDSIGNFAKKAVGVANSGLNTMKNAHTVAQKESCMGCLFVWGKVHAASDQSSGYDDVKKVFEEVCSVMPDVFYDACDTMAAQEDSMINDYLKGMEIKKMCEYANVCWTLFPM